MRTRALISPNNQNVVAAAILPLATILANISVSIQNCNSLNISTNCPKQLKKLSAITSLGSKIIFLSDIRLNNSPNVQDIERSLLSASHNPYKFFLIPQAISEVLGSSFRITLTTPSTLYLGITMKILSV